MKKGFTLIEVLVASMLMGMLVAVLTMAFNQSAVSWRTGKAGVSQLSDAREKMSWYHFAAARALPHLKTVKFNDATGRWNPIDDQSLRYEIQNAWDDKTGNLNTRALKQASTRSGANSFEFDYPGNDWKQTVSGTSADSVDAVTVGVMSAGPDRKWGTVDDISSWPEEKKKK